MTLVFIHGAGGATEDRPLAESLAEALDTELRYVALPADNSAVEAWAAPIREALAGADGPDPVVGHSFGASILLLVLAEQDRGIGPVAMLGMPDWSPDGWDVADYRHDGPEPRTTLTLLHCRDDSVVPFDHLALHAARLPGARVVGLETGDHGFVGRVREIADVLRNGGRPTANLT